MLAGEIDAAANCMYWSVRCLSVVSVPRLLLRQKESQKLITTKSCTLVMGTWQPVLPRTYILRLTAMYYYDGPTTDPATEMPVAKLPAICTKMRECEQLRGCNGSAVADADRASRSQSKSKRMDQSFGSTMRHAICLVIHKTQMQF